MSSEALYRFVNVPKGTVNISEENLEIVGETTTQTEFFGLYTYDGSVVNVNALKNDENLSFPMVIDSVGRFRLILGTGNIVDKFYVFIPNQSSGANVLVENYLFYDALEDQTTVSIRLTDVDLNSLTNDLTNLPVYLIKFE